MKFSVLISVYTKESPENLDRALESILNQSILPSEIILVKDGPLSHKLEAVIEYYRTESPSIFKIISLKKNIGLGNALKVGLKHCTNDIVARMDSDDISIHNRFEIQLNYLKQHPSICVVGSHIEEFIDEPGDLKRIKRVPQSLDQIRKYSKKRNPINHPSVMFNKKPIQVVGGYEEVLYFEDYYLWLKLLHAGYELANIDEVLLYFRIGNDMIGRRHGYKYAMRELSFAQKAKEENLLTGFEVIRFIATRFPLRLIPKIILNVFYKRIIRKGTVNRS